ncbi:MAG: hypothetical protein NG712_00925 [Omnitrophica bacterium]|nr:hypothetical protein [Candidatus Omnitrophota bacterium]
MSWFSNKRRGKFFIFLLLVFVLAACFYLRREIFFQQAKKLIEQNIENNFPCRISIGTVSPSVIYGLVLEDLEISFPQALGLSLNIKAEQVFVDYNFWKLLSFSPKGIKSLRLVLPTINLSYLQEQEAVFTLGSVSEMLKPKFALKDFAFFLEEGEISLAGAQPLIKNLRGELFLNQEGIYLRDASASFKNSRGKSMTISGAFSEEGLSLTTNIEHLKVGNFDILTNLVLTLNKTVEIQDGSTKIIGSLKTYGSVLNKQPFPELNSSFEIRGSNLRILTFSLGDTYDLRGIISLVPPFDADLSLNFYQAAPGEFIGQFNHSEKPVFSGLVNGLIKVTGPLAQARVEGYLEVKDGNIGKLGFVSANINIKGRYPKILILSSRIFREEDSFLMEGEIDLANLADQSSMELRFMADKGILWQGWDITRKRENQVHMSKSIADDVKVTFDAFMDEESAAFSSSEANELGLEYRVFGDKLIKLRLKKDEGILGLERRVKF